MEPIAFATSSADDAAHATLVERHAELAGALSALSSQLVLASPDGLHDAVAGLVRWAERVLLATLGVEERLFDPAAHGQTDGRALVAVMRLHRQRLAGLVDNVSYAPDHVRAAAATYALQTLFEVHVRTQDEVLLPLLAAAPTVSLGALLQQLETEAPSPSPATATAAATGDDHGCGCNESEPAGDPELDARVIPHAVRHATIFGALDAVAPGSALVLLAPHDPIPLLAQLDAREPDAFGVEYLERGPETWRLRLSRRPAVTSVPAER